MRVHLVALIVLVYGCGPSSPTRDTGPTGKFLFTGPETPVEILHGGNATVPIDWVWKTDSPEEIELSASVEPTQGVTAQLEKARLGADAKGRFTLSVHVSETARAGEYTVTLTGKAKNAQPTRLPIRIKVPGKD